MIISSVIPLPTSAFSVSPLRDPELFGLQPLSSTQAFLTHVRKQLENSVKYTKTAPPSNAALQPSPSAFLGLDSGQTFPAKTVRLTPALSDTSQGGDKQPLANIFLAVFRSLQDYGITKASFTVNAILTEVQDGLLDCTQAEARKHPFPPAIAMWPGTELPNSYR